MSRIGQHVVTRKWGSRYAGEVVAETAKTVSVKNQYSRKPDRIRLLDNPLFFPSQEAAQAAIEASRAARALFSDAYNEAKTRLSEIEDQRIEAHRIALEQGSLP